MTDDKHMRTIAQDSMTIKHLTTAHLRGALASAESQAAQPVAPAPTAQSTANSNAKPESK
jgi:hypothetical protein